jgi:predicted DCC family thiol-disulfide oxidoreductase YuxK
MEIRKIVFYDGDCGFCNRTVQFILNNEKSSVLYFCALQSDKALMLFEQHGQPAPDMSTFYFFDNRFYSKSTAAIRLSTHLKFPYFLFHLAWIFPRFVRDAVYDFVAKRRQRFSAGFCAIPTPEQGKRFIR